tara:strand:+ start:1379 stop:1720 length:342 start_codon:yes stop_codon:yes gene_type:complete
MKIYWKIKESDIMKNEKTKNINIELDEKTAQGQYSNLVVVNHSPTEFVLDFVNIMPGSPKAKVSSRIIITPQHAKKFLKAINENISRYEKTFGEIKGFEFENIPINFGPRGEA